MISTVLKKSIRLKLRELIREGGAPGFQLALGFRDECLGIWAEGVTDKTWFDLASITKIISTSYLTMLALQQKKISGLDEPLQSFFPSWSSALKTKTIRDLLNHRAGLPAIFEKTEDLPSREEKIRYFLSEVDRSYPANPSVEALYSDVGFMILGILLEQVFGKRLKDIFQNLKFRDLAFGPISTTFDWFHELIGDRSVAKILSLEDKTTQLRGRTQDPRADWLEGDAGHSGLFGSVLGVESWAQKLFRAYHGKDLLLSDQTLRSFIQFPRSDDESAPRWINGFDRPTPPSQSGAFFPSTTVGHLGYSGCSFWMDMESGARISLLSHRFSPKIDPEKLRSLRPIFHDWIWKQVFAELRLL